MGVGLIDVGIVGDQEFTGGAGEGMLCQAVTDIRVYSAKRRIMASGEMKSSHWLWLGLAGSTKPNSDYTDFLYRKV